MKILILLINLICCLTLTGQKNAVFDQRLADSLGADKNGMKMYQFVMLTTGPNTTLSKDSVGLFFKGHMENIGHLVKEGKLIVAGPFGQNLHSMRGLFILNVSTKEEAERLIDTDPAIKNGLLHAEIVPWYGSAALPLYLPHVDSIVKEKR